jgi:hypothetical protein
MQREDFEHVIAAAANIVSEDEFVVVGSQAVLGPHPDAPDDLLRSMEVDVYPARAPEKSDLIDGELGDGSRFHETFGVYAHGVGPETAKAPDGWQERLVRVPIPAWLGSARQPVAGRERDWDFARGMLGAGLVDRDELLARVRHLPVGDRARRHIREMLRAL